MIVMKKLILASNSPRRKELLALITPNFTIEVSQVDETYESHMNPQEIVNHLASIKAVAVSSRNNDCVVIGADTIVVCDGEILGKPKDDHDAYRMLAMLSNKEHIVMTGVCIINNNQIKTFHSETKVRFYPLTEDEINDYIQSKEPFDKAGAYGIQGKAAKFIESIEGDYFTVVGLPVGKLYQNLKQYL
jgi:septum formation protein